MTVRLPRWVALAMGLAAAPAMAATAFQPPMNNIDDAYYTCANGGAFMMSYEGEQPQVATMTTSNHDKVYTLKRAPTPTGAQFSNGAVKFWTDGKTVTVTGTAAPFEGCTLKD